MRVLLLASGFAFLGNAQAVWVGNSIPLQNGTIQNMTPFYCELIARGRHFSDLAPGEMAYAGPRKGHLPISIRGGYGTYSQSEPIEIPIAALCFEDAVHTHYLGAATSIFHAYGAGLSTAETFIFHVGDIRRMDGVESLKAEEFASALNQKNVKLPFPGAFASGYQTIQFVNNSHYVWLARMIVGGVQSTWVQPAGGIYYVEVPGYRAVTIDIKAAEPGSADPKTNTLQIAGVWSQIFRGATYGISAENFVLNGSSFRR